MPARIAHPRFVPIVKSGLSARRNQPVDLRPLKRNRDLIWRLEYLKRIFHIHDARHTGEKAFAEGVGLLPVVVILDLLGGRPALIRNFSALDDAAPGRHTAPRRM